MFGLDDFFGGGGGGFGGGGGIFGGGGGGILGGFDFFGLGGLLSLGAIVLVPLIVLLIVLYTFDGMMLRNIGRKAGLKDDWMAFVPFARTVYRLKIVGERWWKLFFLEYSWLYGIILYFFFSIFKDQTVMTLGIVIIVLYALGMIAYNLYYRNKYYKAFGLKGELTLVIITIPVGCILTTWLIDILIAFTDLIQFGAAQRPRSAGQVLHQQPAPGAQRPAPGMQPSADQAFGLSGLSGMYAGQNIPMAANDDLVIGRDAALANIIVDQNADKVSRKHCVIRFDPARNAYTVTDHSTNGTFVDGGNRLVANVPTPLARGTVIALGSRENRFRLN